MNAEELIGILFQSRDIAHLTHLRTSSFAEHKTLNEYYEEILELVDELTETYFGCINDKPEIEIPSSSSTEATPYLTELRTIVLNNRQSFGMENTYLQNIIDEILALISRTLYRLTFN
jgi:hypothetical protein